MRSGEIDIELTFQLPDRYDREDFFRRVVEALSRISVREAAFAQFEVHRRDWLGWVSIKVTVLESHAPLAVRLGEAWLREAIAGLARGSAVSEPWVPQMQATVQVHELSIDLTRLSRV